MLPQYQAIGRQHQNQLGKQCCAMTCAPWVMGILFGMLYNYSAISTVQNQLAAAECLNYALEATMSEAPEALEKTVREPILFDLQASKIAEDMLFNVFIAPLLLFTLPVLIHLNLSKSWSTPEALKQERYLARASLLSIIQAVIYCKMLSIETISWYASFGTNVKQQGCAELGIFASKCLQHKEPEFLCTHFPVTANSMPVEGLNKLSDDLANFLRLTFNDRIGGEYFATGVVFTAAVLLGSVWQYHLRKRMEIDEPLLLVEYPEFDPLHQQVLVQSLR